MPEVIIPAKIRGRKEVRVAMLANTLSDFVILTADVAKSIEPELLGYEEELEVGGGGVVRGPLCNIGVEVEDPDTKEVRREVVRAVILEGERDCIIGIEALEKLGVILDLRRGKFKLG